ncbi:hypothetical protein EDB87DRAFT_1202464 [Lactarius vividus]|nr:hypothetical protein EDB87DRAFT_1202464 [Lactarius vividus]
MTALVPLPICTTYLSSDRTQCASTSGDEHGFPFQKAAHKNPSLFSETRQQPDSNDSNELIMTHTTDAPANKEVHFLHSDDPRDGFHVMGTDPLVFYSFLTPVGFLTTHTIVNDASGGTVATLNWTGSSALGTVTKPGSIPMEVHMGDLVAPFPLMPEYDPFFDSRTP